MRSTMILALAASVCLSPALCAAEVGSEVVLPASPRPAHTPHVVSHEVWQLCITVSDACGSAITLLFER